MKYINIQPGIFQSRPNRFIAHCEINGLPEICHVKNTGRCKELLVPEAKVYLQKSDNPKRSTRYDLISVYKGDRLINMDSQAPNPAFKEWAVSGGVPGLTHIKGEVFYGSSRFDFYLEANGRKTFVEIKGVTLEENGIVMFPDAPTLRGVRHVEELCRSLSEGYDAMIVFIIQMSPVQRFIPNDRTHPEFGDALRHAQNKGVRLLALDCLVTPDTLEAKKPVEICL